MNRPRKKKEKSLMEELRELDLLGEGETVNIPDLANEDLIEENSMSVVVRCLNPTVHKVGGLVKALPAIRGMDDRVRGRGVSEDKVQFIFETEADLYHVLFRGPWFVNGWIVSLDQWKPNPDPDYLNKILFWIRIKGIPIHLLKRQTVESIIRPLGKVDAVELHAKNSNSLEYVRERTWVKADEPLQFCKVANFASGERVPVELTYEKLLKVCLLCKRLTHERSICPFQINDLMGGNGKGTARKGRPTARSTMYKANAKGKGKVVEDVEEGVKERSGNPGKKSLPSPSEPISKTTGVKERLQWPSEGAKRQRGSKAQGATNSVEWRPKKRLEESSAKAGDLCSQGEQTMLLLKRRRQSGSGEKQVKRARLGGEKRKLSKSGSNSSQREEKLSPSVFDRLEPQLPQKSFHTRERGGSTNLDGNGAYQGSNHSVLSVTANHRNSSDHVSDGASGQFGKEGLMVRHLREICGQYFPEVIFLCETKNKRSYLENVVGHLGYHDLHTVEPLGKSGGLALMWKEEVHIKVLHSDKRTIDVQVKWQDKEFFLSCIYGDPVRGERGKVWERLTRIGIERRGPWMMTGDFNELVDPSEKKGGPVRSMATCVEFQQMLSACGLWEVRHKGYQFSWFGNRNEELVQCRLDRTVANQEWMELFPEAQAVYLKKVSSDHSPLITTLMGEKWRRWVGFKYDQRWVQREGFCDFMKETWESEKVKQSNSLVEKLTRCRKEISGWKRRNKPNSSLRIQELHSRIDRATQQSPFSIEEVRRLKSELNKEYVQEEKFWQQKSRFIWLNNGDKNTKFFHAATKNRRAQNRIQVLEDKDGIEWFAEEDLGRVAESYFKMLYTSEDVGYRLQEMEQGTNTVSTEMNEMLSAEVSLEEVKEAVFEINPNKCPGPDGLTGFFFQQFWERVGEDITEMVRSFMRTGRLEEEINRTNICLIPKKMKASKLQDFRPISLCNVVYKIVSKLLASRLKRILPNIISETQAAFVKGRLISDNILIAHEMLHALSSRNKCAENFIAIKTDISKAYDRVEWSFLGNAMTYLGFSGSWIRLVMECVKTVEYQVLINGVPYRDIQPTRGLRQGDPLSPYLFVICTEMLVRMLNKAEEEGKITGLKIASGAPSISHLLFADDSLFYCRKEEEEINQMVRIIEEYSLASGQRVNYQKSSIYFGKLIPEETRGEIKHKLGISKEGGEGIYLGLPEAFKGSKVTILSYLKERLNQRVNGWQTMFLSQGGKEVLLKAVVMALPTYTMTCFKLPRNALASMGRADQAKSRGGIEFRDIEAFNDALLGKQLWRIITQKESLVARVFKSRYFRKSDPLTAPLGYRPSYAWRSLQAAQELLRQGARAVVGNGKEINIWQHQWLQSKPARGLSRVKQIPPGFQSSVAQLVTVKDLLGPDGREWNRDLLSLAFENEDKQCIEEIRPGGFQTKDGYTWDYTKSGLYSVKSGYWVVLKVIRQRGRAQVVDQPSLDALYQQIWKLEAPPKIHHFVWKCLSNCLSVNGNLAYPHISKEALCIRCPNCTETVNHLFFQCPYARVVWAVSSVPAPQGGEWSDSLYANMDWFLNYQKEQRSQTPQPTVSQWVLWRLWKSRNELCFNGKDIGVERLIKLVEEDAEEWRGREENTGRLRPNPSALSLEVRWRPPPLEWVKCNMDGAWPREGDRSGVGWVLRDHQGSVLWMGARALPRTRSVLEVETEALRWAMVSVARFQYKKVIFESDSQDLISAINGDERRPPIATLLEDIKCLCRQFEEVTFKFTKRGGNAVADRIAQETTSFQRNEIRFYSNAPRWLEYLVETELVSHNIGE
ncbi:PREDICTED: uncharacterized protein LOC104763574 [Camelina sativa]|uniref:Uncharacterized protein LOC104763574 n=1 Tax=Camelina sativa TaxID=90675 RepID=A0ABM1R9H4_CAMSA|nr:PREDICTED: uncharacterized protein LOC104763574 [Camelina sativa]